MASLFFSYSHADEEYRDQLEKHLTMLKRQGRISAWHDRRIKAGDPLDKNISKELEGASIVLLLISSDFLASEYCYDIEMTRAMERHASGETRAIPIILRPCDWHEAPFGNLMAAPTDGKPVSKWTNIDDAWLDVVNAIKSALPKIDESKKPLLATIKNSEGRSSVSSARSSNMRIKKEFSDAEKDNFLKNSFEFICRYFENSLTELKTRHPEIDKDFSRIDARRFSATIYRNGKTIAQCVISLDPGHTFGKGIMFSYDNSSRTNSYNECLSVGHDDQTMFLTTQGMFRGGTNREQLTEEGGAEVFWSMLIERLQ